MKKFFYLHGLTTYTDPFQHLGPLKFKMLEGPVLGELSRHQVLTEAIPNLKAKTLSDQIETTSEFLNKENAEEIYLIGHSTGGLVARILSEKDPRIKKVVTIASPHQGSKLAYLGREVFNKYPLLEKTLKISGWDFSKRENYYASLSKESVDKYVNLTQEKKVCSIICTSDSKTTSSALYIFNKYCFSNLENDGIVEESSQYCGKVLGKFKIDHLAAVGHFFHLSPYARKNAKTVFNALIATVVKELISDNN